MTLEQAGFLFLGPKACFVGCFVEDMGDRIMSSVAISSTGTDGGLVTKAVKDFAAAGIVSPAHETGCGGGVARQFV